MDKYAYIVHRNPSDRYHCKYIIGIYDNENDANKIAECYNSTSDGIMWTTRIEKKRLLKDEVIIEGSKSYHGNNNQIKRIQLQSTFDEETLIEKYKEIKKELVELKLFTEKINNNIFSLGNKLDEMLLKNNI